MTAKSFPTLEDQLASVMEREDINVLSADGVRFLRAPATIEIGKGGSRKRRRRSSKSRASYADRPAVSSLTEDRTRDAVADLDRVVVGFGQADKAGRVSRSVPVAIRRAEHARSPFVVSLRGMTLSRRAKKPEEQGPHAGSGIAPSLAGCAAPSFDAFAALASDLHVESQDGRAFAEQFTPATFESAYALSYGYFDELASRFVGNLGVLSKRFGAGVDMKAVWRTALGLSALFFVAALPGFTVRLARSFELKRAAVASASADALGEIKSVSSKPLPESVETLKRASARFREADDVLSGANALAVGLANLLPKSRASFRTARALTEIGVKTSDAAALLAQGLLGALSDRASSPLERLDVMAAYARGARPLLDDAALAGARVDVSALPESERAKVAELVAGVESGRAAVRDFTGLAELLGGLMGRDEARRYLVIFQNPSELRPTGGFMGSFAEVKLERGEIKSLSVPAGGAYDLQGQLTALVAPPAPLGLIADRWEFQDANWSPDFRAAADKIRFFWSKSGGPTVDGVIAVNATLVEKLLSLTGPIEIPELGKTITAGNFMFETQKAVELDYDRAENKPKKILGLLAPRIVERLKTLKRDEWLKALGLLSDALITKDIQVALSQPDEAALAERLGWSGLLKSTTGDSLAIIEANIAGQKTDLSIAEQANHSAQIKPDGSVTDTVTLTRAHTAAKGQLFRGARNVSYIRFYVPRGSSLVSASGFKTPDPALFTSPRDDAPPDPDEAAKSKTLVRHPSGLDVWDEGERTVFGGWSLLDPGETQTLRVSYRLPFSAFDMRERLDAGPASTDANDGGAAYSLFLTSQSGKTDRRFTSQIKLPAGWQARWQRPSASSTAGDRWDRDRVYAALYDVGP